jgi:hypothetical protein
VRLRFRIGADGATGDEGWFIDDLVFTGLTNAPFPVLIADPGPCVPVAVGEDLPTELEFEVAGAHPIRGVPRFRFALPKASRVTISVYDVSGRRVATLADGEFTAGVHHASWIDRGAERRAGVYFTRLVADGSVLDRRVVVLAP